MGYLQGRFTDPLFLAAVVSSPFARPVLLKEWEGLKPDILMIPIGGVIGNTMDVKDALEAVRLIKPKKVIPCHYNCAFLWQRNINPTDEKMFKDEVEKMGIECAIMKYGDEMIV
ncbi:MAG: MBL fold metallo-hydrolase [Proteobacteria bacterium]|nr:MBL fold metallo-hydrolase [Pseudomonadota bacterium]